MITFVLQNRRCRFAVVSCTGLLVPGACRGTAGKKSATGTTNATAYSYDAASRLASTASNGASASAVTSDADGNTLMGGDRTNTWDSQNRLVSCAYQGTASTFTYGADGL